MVLESCMQFSHPEAQGHINDCGKISICDDKTQLCKFVVCKSPILNHCKWMLYTTNTYIKGMVKCNQNASGG